MFLRNDLPASLCAEATETAVLSTVLNQLDCGWMSQVMAAGKTDTVGLFSSPQRRAVCRVLVEGYERGETLTLPTIVDRLSLGDEELFPQGVREELSRIQLHPRLATVEAMEAGLETLSALHTVRTQLKAAEKVVVQACQPGSQPNPEQIAADLKAIVDMSEGGVEAEPFSDVVDHVLNTTVATWALPTSIDAVDEVLGGRGLEAGCLTVVAARPKVGKTIFMNNLICSILDNGGMPAVINLETKELEYVSKILARHIAGLDMPECAESMTSMHWGMIKNYVARVQLGDDSDEALDALVDYSSFSPESTLPPHMLEKRIMQRKLLIDRALEWAKDQTEWLVNFSRSTTMPEIENMVRQARVKAGTKPVVLLVDYVGLQVTDASREREQLTDFTRFYKMLAKEHNISVVILSQINRDTGSDMPKVSHLRGSGSLEQDADTILILDTPVRRKEHDADPYELNVSATSRLSESKDFSLFIDGGMQVVKDLDTSAEYSHSRDDDFLGDDALG